MYRHHATHVVYDLSHLCIQAMRRDDTEEAKRLAKLAKDLEALFPDAAAELRSYAPAPTTGDTHEPR